MQISLGRSRIARLPTFLRRLEEWWLKEFLDSFPERIAEFLSGRGRGLLVVAVDHEDAKLELLNGAHMLIASERGTLTNNALAEIDRFLRSQGLERKDVDFGLRLPSESVFCRKLLLPAEAIDAMEAIVAEDLAKKTPFKSEDIYSDYVALDRGDGNKITIWQWVTRRQYVDQALVPFNFDIKQVAFVVFENSAAERPAPFINLRPKADARNSWYQKAALGLCCSAVILALLAGGLKYWNQQNSARPS